MQAQYSPRTGKSVYQEIGEIFLMIFLRFIKDTVYQRGLYSLFWSVKNPRTT